MGSYDKDSAWFDTKPYANKTWTRENLLGEEWLKELRAKLITVLPVVQFDISCQPLFVNRNHWLPDQQPSNGPRSSRSRGLQDISYDESRRRFSGKLQVKRVSVFFYENSR